MAEPDHTSLEVTNNTAVADVYKKYLETLGDHNFQISKQYDQSLLFFSSGALTLSFTFFGNKPLPTSHLLYLKLGWACFGLTILTTLASLFLFRFFAEKENLAITEWIYRDQEEPVLPDISINFLDHCIRWIPAISGILFLTAWVFLIIFAWTTIE
ncbi:MAG: hypothetical protein KKB57_08340 [Proteobacteria bacterium]|nr:hypothetical protein [Pseudomonadota bacterium]